MSDEFIELAAGGASARVARHGAELKSLAFAGTPELLWQADATYWDRSAPFLFPQISRTPDLRLRVGGHEGEMPQHGFARDQLFAVAAREAARCVLALRDDAVTRAIYPFPFALTVEYRLAARALDLVATVENTGTGPLVFQFGWHPGFVWPLPPATTREGHSITVSPMPGRPALQAETGQVTGETIPDALVDGAVPITDARFARGALVFPAIADRRAVYRGPAGAQLTVEFPDCPVLAIWRRPGGGYVCIEPWQGLPHRIGDPQDLAARADTVTLAAGNARRWRFRVAV